MKSLCLLLFSALVCVAAPKGLTAAEQTMECAVPVLLTLESFRHAMAANPAQAKGLFFQGAALVRWEHQVAQADWEETFVADFFTGAVALGGPSNEQGTLAALYNPWQDAILLLRLAPSTRYGKEQVPLIEEACLRCGEDFRGEALEPLKVETVVPPAQTPLSAVIWQKVNQTVARFDALYPPEASPKASLGAWSAGPAVARAALRASWFKRLGADDGSDLARVQVFARQLRYAKADRLMRFFANPNTAFYCQTWAEVPAEVRRNMVPYGWLEVPGEAGREVMIVYVAANLPSIYATIHLRPGSPATLEWFDLTQAEALQAAREGK